MFLSLRKHVRHWSTPLGRCFFQTERDDRTTPVWRAPEDTTTAPVSDCRAWRATHRHPRPIGGRREAWGLAAVPVGGGRARAGLEIDHSEPSGSRVAISRAGRRPPAHTAARPIKARP